MSYEQALTPPFYCRGRPADMSITADKDQFLGWTNRTVYDSNKAESENWTLSGLEQKMTLLVRVLSDSIRQYDANLYKTCEGDSSEVRLKEVI